MKIAVLGWGSLIWNPGNLEIDKTQGNNGWFDDGPSLPIEFARISKDGRLTLVIVPEKKEVVQTLYAISSFEKLDHAKLDLAVREGCSKNRIGYYQIKNGKIEPSKTPDTFGLELESIEKNNLSIEQQIIQNKYQPKSLAWHEQRQNQKQQNQQRQMLQRHTPKIQQRPRPKRYGSRYNPITKKYYTYNYRDRYY